MSNQNELIQKIASLFEGALDNNNDIREKATSQILEIKSTNPIFLIHASSLIILNDNASLTSKRYSFVILCQMFQPNNETPLQVIFQRYNSLSEEIHHNLRTALLRGLLFPQPEIYKQAAFLVSLIVVVDSPNDTIEILRYLQNMLVSGNFALSARYAALNSFFEIYLSAQIPSLMQKCQGFEDFLITQRDTYFNFLRNEFNFEVPFIIEVVKTLDKVIDNYPKIFEPVEEQAKLYAIFEAMLPHTSNSSLYREIMSVLLTIVRKLYQSQALEIQRIISITNNFIICNNRDFVSDSLIFWINIAKDEIEIIENNNIYRRCKYEIEIRSKNILNTTYDERIVKTEKEYKGFTILFASQSISNVLNVLTQIDPNDKEVEDTSSYQPHMFAFFLLKKLFVLDPFKVYMKINELFDVSVNSSEWVVHHSFLLALASMDDGSEHDFVEELFAKATNFIVKCATSDNDKLSETAVFTLNTIANTYSMYSTEENIIKFIRLIENLFQRSIKIAFRGLEFLQKLIKHKNADVNELFHILINLVISVFNRQDYNVHDLLVKIFDAFQTIISRTTIESIDNIKFFLKKYLLHQLQESTKVITSQEQEIIKQQCLLQTIMFVFRQYPNDLKEEASETFRILFSSIQKMNRDFVTDDILLVLMRLIPALGDHLSEVSPYIFNYIQFNLNSGSPSIIQNAIRVIANFFQTCPEIVMDKLQSTIDFILVSFEQKVFMPSFYPDACKSLYFIIESISKLKNRFDPIIRDKFFAIYKSLSFFLIDMDEDNDFANDVLECSCLGLAYVVKYSDEEEGKVFLNNYKIIKEILEPLKCFPKLKKIKDCTIKAFLELLKITMSCFSKKGNMLIQRCLHTSILIRAIASQNEEISETAQKIWIDYKNI